VDPLFRSAAYLYGPRAVGVVLSGALDDGTAGLWTIKLRGGTAIVQDPSDAQHRSMPLSAMENVSVDHKLPAHRIGELIGRLALEGARIAPALDQAEREKLEREIRIASGADGLEQRVMDFGAASHFTCPECHGTLTQLQEGSILRFRCHTGHAHSAASLLECTTEQVEDRLWDAVRALDETVLLLTEMGEALARKGEMGAAERCFDKARAAHERAQTIRGSAFHNEKITGEALRDAETA
jgi:two-component system chemotaxis response regulator CheB